jgi:hypothetical protein
MAMFLKLSKTGLKNISELKNDTLGTKFLLSQAVYSCSKSNALDCQDE